MPSDAVLKSAQDSLGRIQQFDATALGREGDLGRQMSFSVAIDPAQKLINLYKRIPLSALEDFSDSQLSSITQQSQADFNTFDQVLKFDVSLANAPDTRTNLIANIRARRDQVFDALWHHIAYGVARSTDTILIETQARAAIQSIKDGAEKLTQELNHAKEEADGALTEIRKVAAEQGVSQQAIHFRTEADSQETLATTWLKYTFGFAGAVAVFALASVFLHKIPWIRPETTAEAIQLVSSKFLIFAALGYLLLMAARNYATHKHNAIVNRHRQNALLTYRTLVEASSAATQDIVLAHAASCIFSPQETGFSQGNRDSSPGSKSVLELMTKSATKE
jgi:hypothetical protein